MTGDRGADRAWWSGRSSKPRRRRLRLLRWVRFPHAPATWFSLLLCLAVLPASLAAQAPDTTGRTAADSGRRELKPLPAFFQSLLLPGWAQARLDRKLTASIFVSWEGVTLGMALKAAHELRYLRRVGADSVRIDSKNREKQDWLVLLAFNHLFAGLEAYVGSQLQDFPADVHIRAAPRGVGFEASVPFRIK